MATVTQTDTTIRALAGPDLDAVVAIDAAHTGRTRRAYFERRLQVAIRQPDLHVQLAAVDAQGLVGYILARRTEGEFGRQRPALRLEILGVRPRRRGHGVGRALLDALLSYGRRHAVAELRTAASWKDHGMMRWLDAMAFDLSGDLILECGVGSGVQVERDDALDLPGSSAPGHEVDYGAPEGNDYERVERGRCEVRTMRAEDLAQILRIDRDITGRDRLDYIRGKLGEALDDSAVRVSLSARLDGAIIGFLMARADLGDFGRAQPVAVLDTIGVDPAYGRRGVGQALLSQLVANVGALCIERVETVVRPAELPLLGFLQAAGFARSQRLALRRPV